jgi:hypothetical protein
MLNGMALSCEQFGECPPDIDQSSMSLQGIMALLTS